MADAAASLADAVFLAGGGEMGALMRAHDWATTSLGPPETWPQPLRTAVRLLLNTGHPMFIFWGPEHLCFYNDAYRRTIGPERHPGSLGRPGRGVWDEIWPIIGPQIEQVMSGGEPTWHENQLVPITRYGHRDDVYWTYSYGPIGDEEAPTGVGGVLVVCTETTEQILAAQRARAEKERLSRMFEQAPGFMAMHIGPEHRFELVNPAYLRLIGHREVIGRTVAEALPEVAKQGFIDLLDRVYRTGEPFVGHAVPVTFQPEADGPTETRHVDFVYQPVTDTEGQVTGIFVEGSDVTARVQAAVSMRDSEARLSFLDRLGSETAELADADAVLATTTRLVGEHMGVSVCAYADMDEDEDGFTIRGDWAAPGSTSIVGHYSLACFGKLAVANLGAGLPFVVNDNLRELAPQEAATFQSIGIAATICMPLVKEGRLTALMAIHDRVPRVWTEDELVLLRDVTERSWAHVERVGATAELRESEARLAEERKALATLVEHLPVGVILVDRDGTTLLHNSAYARIVPEATIPSRLPDAEERWIGYDPDGQRVTRERFAGARALRGELVRNAEFLHRAADGQETWTHLSGVPLRDADGEISGAICMVVDIDAQKRAEERLQLATEAAGLGIFDVDFKTGRMDWDARQRELWDVARDAVITDEIFLAGVHPEDRDRLQELLSRAFDPEGKGLYSAEFRQGPREHGSERWIAATGRVHFEGQRPARLIGTVQDISERKRTEASHRESEAQFRAFAQAVPNHVWAARPDGALYWFNDQVYTYTGEEVGTLDESEWARIVHPDDLPAASATWAHALAAGEVYETEFRIRGADGGFRWFLVRAEPVRGAGGEIVNWVGTNTDIHDRRNAETALRDLNETLESRVAERTTELEVAQDALRQSQKLEAMGQLTGGVAHDFNNLLTPIIASLDMLLRRGMGSERERRLMDGALQSAERAKVLVQRLLAFARRQPLQPGPVDVRQLVGGMAELIASTSGPRIDVRVDLPEDLPPALADANQLEMAVLNLAVNARDAMPEAGVLTISAVRESVRGRHPARLRPGHYVRLSVQDTGLGMDEETLARAVEPFFSTKGVGRGTGLGLSMVHGLAEQLHGGLKIKSLPGQGTTVDLWLPFSPFAVEPDDKESSAETPRQAQGTALLVDDEDLVRMSTADMLMDLGYEVVEATSAEEALRLVGEGLRPALVVTDHLMPGMSGVDLARELRADRRDLPVLIISGYADVDGIAPGFMRLAKPFRSAELATSLAALMPTGEE